MEAELPTQKSHADEMQLDSRTRRAVIEPRAGVTAADLERDQVANQPANSAAIPNVQVDMESTSPSLGTEEPSQPYTMPTPMTSPTASPVAPTAPAATTPTTSQEPPTAVRSTSKLKLLVIALAGLAVLLFAGVVYYLAFL